MATTTEISETPKPANRRPSPDRVVVMRYVGWSGYMKMLRIRGDRGRPRMFYLDGDVHLTATSYSHERDKARFGMFIMSIGVALRVPFIMAGSTNYRLKKVDSGFEPDKSYYLDHLHHVRDKKEIDLRIDPPPDLAIEVVLRNSATAAVEISRRLGVPEIWVCTERVLKFMVLGSNGRYAKSATSRAFPCLNASEVLTWIRRPEADGTSDLEWITDLKQWIQEVLLPRVPKITEK